MDLSTLSTAVMDQMIGELDAFITQHLIEEKAKEMWLDPKARFLYPLWKMTSSEAKRAGKITRLFSCQVGADFPNTQDASFFTATATTVCQQW
jgi:hypothetical protein